MPGALWAEAVEVARVEGVKATARGLRLEARMTRARVVASGEVGTGYALA